MSYFDDASLVLIPSGIKNQKIYSVKPLDGSGDLTFTRASSATRVASNGLIEKVRTNLLRYSEDLTNAAWSKFTYSGGAVTVTGSQSDPFGGTNAQKLDITIGTGGVLVTQNITVDATSQYGLSVWLKGAVGGEKVEFDLRDTSSNGVAGPIQTLTTTWTRYTITLTNNGGTSRGFQFRITTLQGATDCTFFAYGAQLEAGVPTDYIATTSAAVSVGPVSGLPRLDYLNSSCPRILLEPQRTNSVTYSEQFDNALWTKGAGTITANNAVSPDGNANADLFTADGTTSQHFVLQSNTSGAKTISFFVKMGTQRYVQILTSGTVNAVANYDLQTGSVGGLGSASTASMIDYGNGWWRLILTSTDVLTGNIYLCFANSLTDGRYPAISSSGTVWIWGAMSEAGATYATSYIPTLGTSVTRVADAASKTGISSLIGQTEGTLFFQFQNLLLSSYPNETIFQIVSGTNQLWARKESASNTYTVRLIVGGVTIWTFASVAIPNGNVKLAVSYKTGDSAVFLNGTQVGSTNTATFSSSSFADLNFNLSGSANPYLPLNQTLLFKTRLTNAQLAELTTL